MRLIGMMDSPYVRRTAVALTAMEIPFRHAPISVFRGYAEFAAINPVVKAPTLLTDDGVVLMESGLILDFAERIARPGFSLLPADRATLARHQAVSGLALAACEKAVAIVYELNLRPAEKQHAPWIERVSGQLGAALGLLEAAVAAPRTGAFLFGPTLTRADIDVAVAWGFMTLMIPDRLGERPALAAFAALAEARPEFCACPQT